MKFTVAVLFVLTLALSVACGDSGKDCDPAYPEVCIAAAPPDLDCGDIEHRRFKVLAPDPYRFDGNKDGVGCANDPRRQGH